MKKIVDWLALALASVFFLTYPFGYFRPKYGLRSTGAGFVGTLAGLFCASFLPQDPFRTSFVLLGVLFVSVAISDQAEELMGEKDDPRIVIDEWAGYLISVAFFPQSWRLWIWAFVLFRIADVTKPLGIRRLGNLSGGWGVVMDDVGAGILVQVILHLLPWKLIA